MQFSNAVWGTLGKTFYRCFCFYLTWINHLKFSATLCTSLSIPFSVLTNGDSPLKSCVENNFSSFFKKKILWQFLLAQDWFIYLFKIHLLSFIQPQLCAYWVKSFLFRHNQFPQNPIWFQFKNCKLWWKHHFIIFVFLTMSEVCDVYFNIDVLWAYQNTMI